MELRLQKCTISDLDILINISKETFIAAFERDNNPKDFKKYIGWAFSKEKITEELNDKNSQFYFVFDKESLIGYFKLNEDDAQTEPQGKDSIELERIYVINAHQGKNIGTWMLEQIIQIAKATGKKQLWLGVWEHNTRAIRFYQRKGFQKFGTHPYFVGTDEQTDWMMRLNL